MVRLFFAVEVRGPSWSEERPGEEFGPPESCQSIEGTSLRLILLWDGVSCWDPHTHGWD